MINRSIYFSLFISIGFVISSCSIDESELYGVYIAPNLKNNSDTLFLKDNGTYERYLYSKNNNQLIMSQSDKWSYDSHYIDIKNFWLDYDRIYSDEMTFHDGKMDISMIPKKNIKGEIEFNYDENTTFVYKKIK